MDKFLQSDRRTLKDRRKRPTTPFSWKSLTGSRRYARRADDKLTYRYVDRYSARSVLVVLVALILSVGDAVLTLHLVSLGAEEINPIMDFFLRLGPLPFLLVKYVLTGISLLWFLIHKNFYIFGGRFSVKYILISIPILYVFLILYELILVLQY